MPHRVVLSSDENFLDPNDVGHASFNSILPSSLAVTTQVTHQLRQQHSLQAENRLVSDRCWSLNSTARDKYVYCAAIYSFCFCVCQVTSLSSPPPVTMTPPSGEKPVSRKKAFKCHYCNHVSKWTGRDVQRHILTTHLGLK